MAQKEHDALTAQILKQYAENNATKTNSQSKNFDLKNYFSVYLPDKVKTGSKQIRILPAADGGTPFKEMFIHSRQINGKWKKFTCLNHNFDKDCPFCEARNELLGTKKDSDKELAKTFGSRKMYVLRVIERENEEDGIKFWRFNHDYRNQGIMDKIITLFKLKGNITDAENGRDLTIDIGRDQKGNCIVTGIGDHDPSPALDDPIKLKELIEDTRTWEDVYAVKTYEYLEIAVVGGEPVWDKESEKWVDKNELKKNEDEDDDSEINMGSDDDDDIVTPEPEVSNSKTNKKKSKIDIEDDDDDLPF